MEQRIDKWLWHARFYRTRVTAQSAASAGLIRLNGQRISKSSAMVKPGDVLTVPRGSEVIVLQVLAIAVRRGGATEARRLYEIVAGTAA